MNLVLALKSDQSAASFDVFQKINLLGAARALRAATRSAARPASNFMRGTRVGFRESYHVARRGGRETLHVIADRAGLAGVRAGISTGVASGKVVRAFAPRVARARVVGQRIGAHLREGGRGWVNNARVAGGGFWRRLRG